MTATDDLLVNNARYAAAFENADLPVVPRRKVAILACMDARLDIYDILGLKAGEAHVIRNAGGAVTDDAIRSLLISQRLLGTREIVLVHHTECGMLTFSDDAEKARIAEETGIRPPFALEAFSDLDADLRQSIARIRSSPYIPEKNVRGFVYDVRSGELREVSGI